MININDINMFGLVDNMHCMFDNNDIEFVKNEILSLVYEYKFIPRKRIRTHTERYYKNNRNYLNDKKEIKKKWKKIEIEDEAVRIYNNMYNMTKKTNGQKIRIMFTFIEFLEYFELYIGPKPGPEYHFARIDQDGDYCPGNVGWILNRKKGKTIFKDIRILYALSYISKFFEIKMDELFDISIRKGYISRYTKLNSFRCALSRQKVNMQ